MKTTGKHFDLIGGDDFYGREEMVQTINNRLDDLGMSGKITFVVDYGMKNYEMRKIKYANRRMAFAIPSHLQKEKNDLCRFLIESKKQKFLRAGYTMDYVFPNRDEQFQDFLEQFIFDGDDDVRGVAFLSNLFQHRKME